MQLQPPRKRHARTPQFWAEMAPCEHAVQIYTSEDSFVHALEGFVADGLDAGEAVIVIATEAHRHSLRERLANRGVSLAIAAATDRFIALDAEETMSRFMVGEWPDEVLFETVILDLLKRARNAGSGVRAFGEMVALMWAKGQNGATVRLEHLWHQLCAKEKFTLFCAYPRSGFTQDAEVSIREICDSHSMLVAG